MAFVVIYDACVLYPAPLRDLLLRIATIGIVRARWSDTILDECFRNILKNRPDLQPGALDRTRALMKQAVPDCLVSGFEPLIPSLTLPDADDRHVLAAAIRAGAQAIITFNLSDFPAEELDKFGVEAKHPDDFVLDTLDLAPGAVICCRRRAGRSPQEPDANGRRATRDVAIERPRAICRQAPRAVRQHVGLVGGLCR